MTGSIKKFFIDIYRKGFFHLFSANTFVIFLGFISHLVIAAILPAEEIGRIKTLQSYSAIFIIIATLGFNISTLKLCSDPLHKRNKLNIFADALKITFLLVVVVYIVTSLFSLNSFLSNDSRTNSIALIYFLAIIPAALNTIALAYYRAEKKFQTISKIQASTKSIGLVLIIALTYYYNLIGYSIGYALTFLLTFIIFVKPFIKSLKFKRNENNYPLHWKYAKFSFSSNLVSELNVTIDIFLINFLLADQEIFGQYAFALNFILFLRLIPATIQQISIPYFSEKASDFKEWKRVFTKYNRILVIATLLVAIIVTFVIPFFIHFVFSGKFDESIPFFYILLGGWVFRSFYFLRGGGLIGLGKIEYNFYSALIILPINFVVQYIMISKYGIWGAAISNTLIGIITFFVVWLLFNKATKEYETTLM